MSIYKMICLDIDGTLVNSEHKITAKTKAVIQKTVTEKKIPVILVSARPPKGIFFLQEELEIIEPIICYSGAFIVEKPSKVILDIVIPAGFVEEIYNVTEKMNIHMSIYCGENWYVSSKDKWSDQEGIITNMIPEEANYGNLIEGWKKNETGPNKILCMAEPEDIKKLHDVLKTHGIDLNIHPSKPTYLEIMPPAASKTKAIEFLKERYGVERTQIIAIGDNYNDVDMIKYAGLGIAMGNAPMDVKLIADEITETNDEDGVANAIEKYVFCTLSL